MLDGKVGDNGSMFSPVMVARIRCALVTGAIVGIDVWCCC